MTPPRMRIDPEGGGASPVGSMLYDNAQALARKVMTAWQEPAEWLDIPPGGIALDVGSGPGT